MRTLRLAVVLLCSLAASGAARADGRSLVVLDLKAPPLMKNLGRTLSSAVAEQARSQGFTVLDSRDLAARVGAERADAAADCGADAACLSAALAGLSVDRVIGGTFDKDPSHYLVRMVHVDLSDGHVVSRLERDVLIASRRLGQNVREGIPALLEGAPEQLGTLVVTAAAPGAEILVDGRLVGGAPEARVELKPGKHTLVVRAKDHLTLERFVEVRAGETTRLEANLFLEPGKTAPAAAPGKKHSDARGPILGLPTGTVAGLATAVALTGFGAYYGVQARTVQREAVDLDHDGVLDLTRARALEGRNAATSANVLYGLAGTSVLIAAVFAVLPSGHGAAAEAPQPVALLTPDSAYVGLGGRFR